MLAAHSPLSHSSSFSFFPSFCFSSSFASRPALLSSLLFHSSFILFSRFLSPLLSSVSSHQGWASARWVKYTVGKVIYLTHHCKKLQNTVTTYTFRNIDSKWYNVVKEFKLIGGNEVINQAKKKRHKFFNQKTWGS